MKSLLPTFLQKSRSVHGVGRKDGLVLPEDGFAGGEGVGHVQQALVGAAPETQGNIILRLDEGPVRSEEAHV